MRFLIFQINILGNWRKNAPSGSLPKETVCVSLFGCVLVVNAEDCVQTNGTDYTQYCLCDLPCTVYEAVNCSCH